MTAALVDWWHSPGLCTCVGAASVATAECQLCLAAGDKPLLFHVRLCEVAANVTAVKQETTTTSYVAKPVSVFVHSLYFCHLQTLYIFSSGNFRVYVGNVN